jgi:hypothetical protein
MLLSKKVYGMVRLLFRGTFSRIAAVWWKRWCIFSPIVVDFAFAAEVEVDFLAGEFLILPFTVSP